jgi:hypothetical protein
MQRLTAAARVDTVRRRAGVSREHVVRSPEGAIIARGQSEGRGGGVTIGFPAPTKHARPALVSAVEEILDHMTQTGRAVRRTDR